MLALCISTQAQAGGGEGVMVNENMLLELKQMLERQQAQINKQAEEIASLKKQLAGNNEVLATKADKNEIVTTEKTVTSSLYGHVNKAALFVDNGDSSKVFIVDNINSQTRLGLRANAEVISSCFVSPA